MSNHKQYLLSEDQIERMLACAIELTAEPDLKAMNSRDIEDRFRQPDKGAHTNAILIFNLLKHIDIIEPINQN